MRVSLFKRLYGMVNPNVKYSFLALILLAITLSFTLHRPQKKVAIRKVVIDAGHGGHDPGTVGKRSKEKDIALSVSLQLGRLIQENFQDVEVVYTRKTDVFVELYRRAKIANESKADLFISIHCNGTKSSAAHGVETWVMGLHKSKENLEVAKKENASILMEDSYNQYDGFDPNSPEANIVFSLYQNVYLDQSLDIATRIQGHFRKSLGLLDRGVKQAGFWVLYKTTMPGILVETGFLSNPDDEAYLLSAKGQQEISQAIFQAFKDYKAAFEDHSPVQAQEIAPAKEERPPIKEYPAKSGTGEITVKPATTTEQKAPVGEADKVVFKVQIVSSTKKLHDNAPQLKGVKLPGMYYHQGVYKYTTGEFGSLAEALELQSEMKKKGFKDAFVIAFFRGERISVEDAKQIHGN